jgi:ABC-type lipoprotein export system ATPase subunit
VVDRLVEAVNVGKQYGSGRCIVQALRGISCQVLPGEIIALTGPSGSGKSTLLNLLAGLDTPTTGEVRWPALGQREGLRPGKIAIVFQGPSLLAPLSIAENVRLPMLLNGTQDAEATVLAEEALDRLHVAELRNKLPDEISGGQAQRVAIARALGTRPALLLADEPTGQMDMATGTEVITTLLTVLRELPAAAVLATHDPRVAERFDIRWEMAGGRLITEATCST